MQLPVTKCPPAPLEAILESLEFLELPAFLLINGIIAGSNRTALEFFQYSASEVTGKGIRAVIPAMGEDLEEGGNRHDVLAEVEKALRKDYSQMSDANLRENYSNYFDIED
ncbi:MAG: hypothetical protein ABSG42_01150 [Nitrospirota bacterium]